MLLPFYIWRTTYQRYPLRQETHQDHQPQHRYYHALQKINPTPQRVTLGEKRQRSSVWRNNGKLWRLRSMWTSRTFHLERPHKQIRNKQHRTLQGRRTRHFQEHNRTSSIKDTERNSKGHGLKITIQRNLKSVNYLDITLNLTNGLFQPFRKPNDEPLYINTKLTTHPLPWSKYPQPSIADYQPYHPTKKHSTKPSISTAKPSYQVGLTKAFTTVRKTQPHLQKEIENETSSGLTPLQQKCPNQRR